MTKKNMIKTFKNYTMVCSAYYYIVRQTVLSRLPCLESLLVSMVFQNNFVLLLFCVQFMTFSSDNIKLEQNKFGQVKVK